MNNRHPHRSNSNIKVVSLAKNHATKEHMCEHMWAWKGLMGCWGLSSCTEVKEGQWFRWRTCSTLTVGLSMDMARGVVGGWRTLSPSAEPAALTVAVAKASWNAFERTASNLVWRHRNPQVQPVFLGKPWSLTRMLSLGFTAHSWKENWVIFYPYMGVSLMTTSLCSPQTR